MNAEITTQKAPLIKIVRPHRRFHIPRLFNWLFTVFALFVLAGLLLPTTGNVQVKGMQTKALAQARQIGMALKLFADDHDGHYPGAGFPNEMKTAPADANAAFACLFPVYTQSETIFGNKLSVYQTRQPDNVVDDPYTGVPVKTLEPGENVYGYVAGLKEADDGLSPLVIDGTDGTGHYRCDPSARGGVWNGIRAIVIRLNGSGAVEYLTGPDDARYVSNGAAPLPGQIGGTNLLDFTRVGEGIRLLDPAVGPRRR